MGKNFSLILQITVDLRGSRYLVPSPPSLIILTWAAWIQPDGGRNNMIDHIPTTSWQIDGETMKTVTDFIFLVSKNTADGDCSHGIKRHLLLGRKTMRKPNSVHFSHFQLFVTPWTVARQASLSITNSRSLLKLMSIESVMPSNHLILCHFLLLLPSIFPSIRVFSNQSALHIRWPKYWSFSFSISPSNEYLGLISFRMDSFDLLEVQGTLKSLLQHHSSKASILRRSAFFMVHTRLLEKPQLGLYGPLLGK